MTIKGTALTMALSLLTTCTFVHAAEVRNVWVIPIGNGRDEISSTHDMLYWFDFEVYHGKLLITDIDRHMIKMFDVSGKCVGSINLPGTPEIMSIWNDKLVVLVQNGQLAVYDLERNKLKMVNIGVQVKPYSYSGAYFSDSLLFIPKQKEFIQVRSDSYIIDISKLPNLEIRVRRNAFYIDKKINWPDSLVIRKNYYIQQMDYCFNSKRYSVIARYDKNNPSGEEEEDYFFLDKRRDKFTRLPITENKQRLMLNVNTCRGFKVYKDAVYFITEIFEKGKATSLAISSVPIPK